MQTNKTNKKKQKTKQTILIRFSQYIMCKVYLISRTQCAVYQLECTAHVFVSGKWSNCFILLFLSYYFLFFFAVVNFTFKIYIRCAYDVICALNLLFFTVHMLIHFLWRCRLFKNTRTYVEAGYCGQSQPCC